MSKQQANTIFKALFTLALLAVSATALCQDPIVPAAAPAGAPHPHPIILSKPAAAASAAHAAEMSTSFENGAPTEQVIHMVVGRTIFVDTKNRLTRVYVTDPTILNSYTATPNQVVLTALKPGSATLLVWDETGGSQAYIISADVDVEALAKAMKDAFPAESIEVHGSEGRVLLTGYVGTDAASDNAAKLATLYAKDVSNSLVVNSSRVKQVRLKVRIIEIDRSKAAQFGFNFFSAGGNNLASTTTGAFGSTLTATQGAGAGTSVGNKSVAISNPLNFSLYSSKLNIGATLQDLANMNIAQILAEPTITTMSGLKANFLAGGEFPFPVVQGGSATQAATVTIMFRSYGVKLEFTPKVNSDGTIDLKVAPEVSALDFTNAGNDRGLHDPGHLHAPRRHRNGAAKRTELCYLRLVGPSHLRHPGENAGHCEHSYPRRALQVEEYEPRNFRVDRDCHTDHR